MKTKLSLVVVLCFLLSPTVVYAQPPEPQTHGGFVQGIRFEQQRTGTVWAESVLRSYWDGLNANSELDSLLRDPDARTAWGVSDEQFQQFNGVWLQSSQEFHRGPEFQKFLRETSGLLSPADPWGINIDAETCKKLRVLEANFGLLSEKVTSDALSKVLMPELKQKMNEAFLANMATLPLVTPNMFEALGLTDGQKQQMRRIKEEFEPEFRRIVETFINDQLILVSKVLDELEKQGYGADANSMPEDRGEAIQKKLLAEDPEYKRIYEEGRTQIQSFTTRFRLALFDVLTDEQWMRLQNLVDDPPAHAKVLRERMEWLVEEHHKISTWHVNNLNSWRTGEAIFEEYRQARNAQ